MPVGSKVKIAVIPHIGIHFIPGRIDDFTGIHRLAPFTFPVLHIPDILSPESSRQLVGHKIQAFPVGCQCRMSYRNSISTYSRFRQIDPARFPVSRIVLGISSRRLINPRTPVIATDNSRRSEIKGIAVGTETQRSFVPAGIKRIFHQFRFQPARLLEFLHTDISILIHRTDFLSEIGDEYMAISVACYRVNTPFFLFGVSIPG